MKHKPLFLTRARLVGRPLDEWHFDLSIYINDHDVIYLRITHAGDVTNPAISYYAVRPCGEEWTHQSPLHHPGEFIPEHPDVVAAYMRLTAA